MAALLERGGQFYAQFFDENQIPKRKRISLKTRKRPLARSILTKLEEDYLRGRFDPWSHDPFTYTRDRCEPLTLEAAFLRFLDQKQSLGRSDNTLRTYREVMSLLLAQVGPRVTLSSVSQALICKTIRASHLSKATQHKRFGHLRTFFRWCSKERLLVQSPLEGFEPPEKPSKLPKAITQEDLVLICEAVRQDYTGKLKAGLVREGELIWRVPLFQFAFYTGMRASELARLRWKDIDFRSRLIIIRKQKNRKEQTIPLNRRAAEILEDVPSGSPEDYIFRPSKSQETRRSSRCFREKAAKAFREARRRAGIQRPVSFHSLRHGFCTKLAEAGKPVYIIKEAARHADISTSMIYVHMANEHLKMELDDVFR